MADTVAARLARWIADIDYSKLPDEVIREARRCMLDTLGVQVRGQRVTNGSRFWQDQICSKDSTLVQRYRAAGLVLIGMTSTASRVMSS